MRNSKKSWVRLAVNTCARHVQRHIIDGKTSQKGPFERSLGRLQLHLRAIGHDNAGSVHTCGFGRLVIQDIANGHARVKSDSVSFGQTDIEVRVIVPRNDEDKIRKRHTVPPSLKCTEFQKIAADDDSEITHRGI
jgi:hypothetical protein